MALPSSPLLDDFSRANENPLSQRGAWLAMDPASYPGALQLSSQSVSAVNTTTCARYYSTVSVTRPCEVWLEVVATGAGFCNLYSGLQTPGSTFAGYALSFSTSGMTLAEYEGSLFINPTTSSTVAPAVGDVWVMRVEASTMTAYRISGGVTSQIISRTMVRFLGTGFFGLAIGANSTAWKFRNLGGGAITAPVPAPPFTSGFGAA